VKDGTCATSANDQRTFRRDPLDLQAIDLDQWFDFSKAQRACNAPKKNCDARRKNSDAGRMVQRWMVEPEKGHEKRASSKGGSQNGPLAGPWRTEGASGSGSPSALPTNAKRAYTQKPRSVTVSEEKKKAEKTQAQILSDAFEGMRGRRPESDRELNEWLATDEGKQATIFEPTLISRWGETGHA
jgi:hypothetical protein